MSFFDFSFTYSIRYAAIFTCGVGIQEIVLVASGSVTGGDRNIFPVSKVISFTPPVILVAKRREIAVFTGRMRRGAWVLVSQGPEGGIAVRGHLLCQRGAQSGLRSGQPAEVKRR